MWMCLLGHSGLIYVSSSIPDQVGVSYKTLKSVFEGVRQFLRPIQFYNLAANIMRAHNKTRACLQKYIPVSILSARNISQIRIEK